jgi:hypothetical protein
MKGETMKNWQITGFLVILIGGFLLISGCTQDNYQYCSDKYPGTVYDPSSKMCEKIVAQTSQITPILTPSITATENINSIRTQLNSEWGQIRDVYDAFIIKKEKDLITSYEGIYGLTKRTIPNTISEYQKIKNDLLIINITNSDLQEERSVLVSICDYKIKFLQGMSLAYQAEQDEKYSLQTSLTEYTNAKLSFRDERDIISGIPYSSKYWEYIYKDDLLAETNIELADENILRISKLIK